MGKIVMPKNSALLNEIESVLKIYYEANDWIPNDLYKTRLKALIGDDQYSSSYTKKHKSHHILDLLYGRIFVILSHLEELHLRESKCLKLCKKRYRKGARSAVGSFGTGEVW